MKPIIDFWFDFASSYSYPAAMRIDGLAERNGINVNWRPFLLGPIFIGQGWRDSPFNLYPLKGRYMWRDLERICAREGLPLWRPEPFPQNSLLAARCAMAIDRADRAAFAKAIFASEFGQGAAIDDPATIARALVAVGLTEEPLDRARTDAVKQALRAETDEAKRLELFGAPSFVTEDGELFWGNDRLEDAIAWAVQRWI